MSDRHRRLIYRGCRTVRVAAPLLFLILTLLIPQFAGANPLEAYGLGGRSVGLAGADQGCATDYTAGFTNPAGAAFVDHPVVALGYQYFNNRFKINTASKGAEDASGLLAGFLYAFRFSENWRLTSGLALYVPEQRAVRIRLMSPEQPRFLQFDNRPQRLFGSFFHGLRYKGFALGVSANIFADARGRGALFVMKSGPSRPEYADSSLELDLQTKIYPSLGAQWQATDWLRLGFHWVAAVSLKADTSTDADLNLDLVVVQLTGNAGARLMATDYYTPQTFAFSVALGPVKGASVMLSVQYLDWSGYSGAFTTVLPDINLKMGAEAFRYETLSYPYKDQRLNYQITAAAGVEYVLDLHTVELSLRGGYKFIPSPLFDPSPDVILLDHERHVFALGLGVMIPAFWVLTGPIEVNLGIQYQFMSEGRRSTSYDTPVAPLRYSGQVIGGVLDVAMHF